MPESQQDIHLQKVKLPKHPIISDCPVKSVAQRDTLDRVGKHYRFITGAGIF